MRIRIMGSGAVGALLGGLLAYKGHEVFFSGNQEFTDYLEKYGLRILLPNRWLKLSRLKTNVEEGVRNPVDFLFITLKRHHLRNLSRDFLAKQVLSFDPPGKILFFNCNQKVLTQLSPEETESFLCLTLLTSVMLQPGDVELCSQHSVLIMKKNKDLRNMLFDLKGLDIAIQEVEDVEPYANSFFIWQLLFLPVAMCHTTYDNFLSYPEGREIALRVLTEGLETFLRKGQKLKKLPHMDPQDLLNKIEKGSKEFAVSRFKPDRAYNSLLQSILTKKMTETRELNGKLIKMAAEAGVDPLWNWRLTEKLNRVIRVGYYRNPAELYNVIR